MSRHGISTARAPRVTSAIEARRVVASGNSSAGRREGGWPRGRERRGRRRDRGGGERRDPIDDGGSPVRRRGSRIAEQCLTGPEVSFFALCDGTRAMPLSSAQDHKRVFDDDRGPNTGGMGAFSPSPLVDEGTSDRIMRDRQPGCCRDARRRS